MANGHGGARRGAGRKPKAQRFASAIADAEQRIADRLPRLIDTMFRLADGVLVQTTDEETGTVDTYLTPPDRKANEYLINRVLGTPTQRVEIDPDADGTLEVTAAAMSEATKELAEWRRTQTEMLSSLPSVSPTLPTPVIPTVS